MLEWINDFGWIIWLTVFLLLAVAEMLTLNLYFILMSVGALAALVAFLFHAPLWLQIVIFCVVALATTVLIRPLALAHLRRGPADQLSNVDRLIGHPAVVLEAVSTNSGLVKIGGDVWTARIRGGAEIPVGAGVEVSAIDGATAIISSPGAHRPTGTAATTA
ncbi:membrane protein implicated in regulation of membrane protease activity [Arthrobacter silviterrae]|uniref:NfeD family protein n=1 Tax=Arthrobacter silviterrae TaxID=2026658 RepID=A0ABX0D720_9MICC|nr:MULTISPECIES: NfeD family protein [Arthrobacter]MCU6480227.1 NfeD family protein [Arthrobacter sp. A2-55]MDQ0276211.1 membrane protein implicated in regulation of membrane protease activity [Arthrobacter silviterrae]NGN82676.1 NfeD family protein [Arthrobacter silviterrae]